MSRIALAAIELNPSCPGVTPPAGQRLLAIEVDAQASLTFQYAAPRTALMLVHWAIETDNGDLRAVDACSPHPGVFAAPLEPGAHPRDSVVILAPSRATWVWLEYEEAAYRWPVRPPV